MITYTTDILVVGGGISGYAAAMAAGENKNVILVDKANMLGGATTLSNVGTLCGFYYRSEKPSPVNHPFCQYFTKELFLKDPHATIISLANGLHVISYEWSNLNKMLTRHLQAKGITVFYDSELVSIHTNSGSITSAEFISNEKQVIIHCQQVIDCTGNGSVATRLNHPMISETCYQSSAQVFRLSGVRAADEYSLSMSLKKALLKQSENGLRTSYLGLSVVPGSLRDGYVDLKLPLSTTVTDETELTALMQESNTILPFILQAIRQVSSLADSTLEKIFPSPGIRIQQRPSGKGLLKADDVLTCAKPPDGIAIGTWPVEDWSGDGKMTMEFFKEDDGYTISSTCLKSDFINNLWFAGKGISAEPRAVASARVTGTCLQTGYAAGKLASMEHTEAGQKFIEDIQNSFFP